MSAKAGEIARETAAYRCENCNRNMVVSRGCPITDCPYCGHESFNTGWRTLEKPAGRKGADVLIEPSGKAEALASS